MKASEGYYWKSYAKGSFNNYVDKKRGEGVSRKSKLGHLKKGQNWVNLGPRSCCMTKETLCQKW